MQDIRTKPQFRLVLVTLALLASCVALAQDAPDGESADLEIRLDAETTKFVTVTVGQELMDIIRKCRPGQPYADDDPWIAYSAGTGGRYVLFFDSGGDAEDHRDDPLHLVAHYPKNDQPGEFLLPSNLRGKPCGEHMTLSVLTDSGEKWKAVSLALLMSARDVRGLFEGAEDLLEDRDKMLYQAKGGGAFLLVFTPSKEAESKQRVLSDVIYRYGDPEKTIHLFPRKRRGSKPPREYLELLDRARVTIR